MLVSVERSPNLKNSLKGVSKFSRCTAQVISLLNCTFNYRNRYATATYRLYVNQNVSMDGFELLEVVRLSDLSLANNYDLCSRLFLLCVGSRKWFGLVEFLHFPPYAVMYGIPPNLP